MTESEPKKIRNTGFNKNHLWWQIATLILISLFSVYASGAFDQEFSKFMPEKMVLVSTTNQKQSGISGLKELTEKLGTKTKLWTLSYRELKDFSGALVMVAPNYSLASYDTKKVLNWVKKGNTLIYIDDFKLLNSRILTKKLKVRVKNTVEKLDKSSVTVNSKIPWLEGIDNLRVSTDARLVGGTNLAGDKSGSVLVSVEHGKGNVIIGCCPRMFSNDLISDKRNWNNFQFFINWAGTQSNQIYFDEKIHGLTGGRNVFLYLSRGPFGYVGLQLMLIVLIAFLSSVQRFGKAKSISEARRISNLEFIDGLSNAYKRAKANASVLEILFHSFRVETSKMLGVSAHEKDEVLISAWNNSPLLEGVELEKLINEYNEVITNRRISDVDLQKMIATCDKITNSQTKGDLEIANYAKSS